MRYVESLLSGTKENNLKEKYVLIVHDVQLGEHSAIIYSEC